LEDVNRGLFDFLNLSIDDAIKSDNPIIRAFATLDRRFGRRRLGDFDESIMTGSSAGELAVGQ
jgi:hypothetical protein